MPAMTFVAPLLPGKEEKWRRFVQEVVEEHLPEYEQLKRRLGVHSESVWLARTKEGATVRVHLQVESPAGMAAALATSDAPFDVWFKERFSEFHGHALVDSPGKATAKLIFASPDVFEDPSSFGEGIGGGS